MESLIVINKENTITVSNKFFNQKMKSIQNATLTYSYEEFVQLTSIRNFDLIVILTDQPYLSPNWDLKEVQMICPVIVLTNINYASFVFIQTLVESFDNFKDVNVKNTLLSKSLDFITNNLYDSELSLERVASHVFMNKCQYSRFFLEKVGIGFKNYVINKRIQKAKILLEKGHSVTEVCYSIGYNDLTHFSRMFKRIVGQNPSEYRTKYIRGVG